MEARLRAHVTPLYKGKCALGLISGNYMEESLFTIFVSLAKSDSVSDKATKISVLNIESAERDVRNTFSTKRVQN